MAKSGENFITLVDFIQKGDVPLVYRYLLLTTHYRSPMNFSWEAVNAAGIARKNIIRALWQMPEDGKVDSNFLNQFTSFINDDLGTPQALALVFEVLKSDIADADKKATILKFDEVLGLRLDEKIEEESIEIPIAVQNLLKERDMAREKKDFARSDMLRTEIANLGYHIDDTPDGVKVSKK
jgi:cysteinyl-tRNA synthetase